MKKITVGLDFRPALSRATGVGRYFQGLVSGLCKIDHENDYVLFSSSWKERPVPVARPQNFRVVDRRVPVTVLNALWHRAERPSFDRLSGAAIDVAHSPTPLLVPSLRARSIVTVCDLFFLERPDATGAEIRRDYVELVRSHVHRADAVLAISETTAKDVRDELDVDPEHIHVVPAGIDPSFLRPSASLNTAGDGGGNGAGPDDDYLLCVATIEPRKNLVFLLEAISMLRDGGWDGRLRIAGGPGCDSDRVTARVSELELFDVVEMLGYVDVDRLRRLYRNARAVVSPSVWEGFGLPLLEAMASETPLVASDIPVHREVADDAAVFASPTDVSAWADAIERVWESEPERATLVAKGRRRVRDFSWERSAERALALYRSLGGGAG